MQKPWKQKNEGRKHAKKCDDICLPLEEDYMMIIKKLKTCSAREHNYEIKKSFKTIIFICLYAFES
jgi:hypothetical protein